MFCASTYERNERPLVFSITCWYTSGLLKIGLLVEVLEKLCDGIGESVPLHGDDAHQLLEHASPPGRGEHRDGQIPEQMGASRLYGVEIPVGEEEFCDKIPSIRVVAEQEERPVHQPRTLLQLHDGRCVSTRLNRLLERVDVPKRLIPVGHQDFASELAPLCRESVFGVGREEPERDKQVGRVAIVAAVVNKLGVPLERLHVSGSDRVLLLQERLVEQLL